jgi:phage shock protein C
MTTPLCRSRTDRLLGGVCGGLGRALGVDPIFFRLGFLLLTLGGGTGVLLYLTLWVITPLEGEGAFGSPETIQAGAAEIAAQARMASADTAGAPSVGSSPLVGLVLVLFGTGMLLRTMGMHWFAWMHMGVLWPLLLIIGGVALLLRRKEGV